MIEEAALTGLLPDYLVRQPWFAHGCAKAALAAGGRPRVAVDVRRSEVWRDNGVALVWAVADAELDGESVGAYQVLIGVRPAVPLPAFLIGATSRILGTLFADGDVSGELIAYDALVDPELTITALEVMFDDLEGVHSVRKLTAGRTSTSVVADEQWLCKVFRRVQDGANPGVEMPEALVAHGFRATLETVESWRPADVDLALRRPFLPGAANGFDFAAASLRELLASGLDPDHSPGDFSAEARRLGEMVADMHGASARAFGVTEVSSATFLAELGDAIGSLGVPGADASAVASWTRYMTAHVAARFATVRVHGNLHLGQLLRSDQGWLILDFEGAPLLATHERRIPRPAWLDVGAVLRSFDYVVAFTMTSRSESLETAPETATKAARWVGRNTAAFLEGYQRTAPAFAVDGGEVAALFRIGEVARAAYEVAYERANRPATEEVPAAALRRLLATD